MVVGLIVIYQAPVALSLAVKRLRASKHLYIYIYDNVYAFIMGGTTMGKLRGENHQMILSEAQRNEFVTRSARVHFIGDRWGIWSPGLLGAA